jgi:hypothetical protein
MRHHHWSSITFVPVCVLGFFVLSVAASNPAGPGTGPERVPEPARADAR